MQSYNFTGNLFVDAGIAGMCAAADVEEPSQLNEAMVQKAVDLLLELFTSPQALEPRPKPGDPKSVSAFATSEMSTIFPNGPHANPSIKGENKIERYKRQILGLAAASHEPVKEPSLCFACGQPANVIATKMDFPLLDSRHNFHPALASGHTVCAKCALAVQFLPLSVFRTNPGGMLWFLSGLQPDICVTAAKFNLQTMESCRASNDRLRFFGEWNAPGQASAVVSAVELLTRERDLGVARGGIPITRAVFFSNDNRGGRISMMEIPSPLFTFLHRLHVLEGGSQRFLHEVLHVPKIGESVARRMLAERTIVRQCMVKSDDDQYPLQLLGGWTAQRLYMEVVLNMNPGYIRTVEAVARRIAEQEDAEKVVNVLWLERNAMRWLLSALQRRLFTKEELYHLVPPNDYYRASEALDYVAAATTEVIRCRREGREFVQWKAEEAAAYKPDHPLIRLVEEVGTAVYATDQRMYDPKKLCTGLSSARSQAELRKVWLRAVRAGIIPWRTFVELVPPGEGARAFMTRDYMLAYLYDQMNKTGEPVFEEVEIATSEAEESEQERIEE